MTARTGRPLRAVLFDMDGTLVDSHLAVARAWAYWSRARGVDPAEVARVAPGRPVAESLAALAPWLTGAERDRDTADLLRRETGDLADIAPMPGALDLLDSLRRWSVPYAVVTSADDALARARLTAAGIAPPRVLVTSDTVRRGKPDPEGYLLAAGRLGIPARRCLVVEDTGTGAAAGRAAGAFVVGLGPVAAAHLSVPGLADLHGRLSGAGGALRVPAGERAA